MKLGCYYNPAYDILLQVQTVRRPWVSQQPLPACFCSRGSIPSPAYYFLVALIGGREQSAATNCWQHGNLNPTDYRGEIDLEKGLDEKKEGLDKVFNCNLAQLVVMESFEQHLGGNQL